MRLGRSPPRPLSDNADSGPPLKIAIRNSVGTGTLLRPAMGVREDEIGWVATSDCPWLVLQTDVRAMRGLWLELIYAASLFDRLVRPCLRFITDEGDVDALLAGPIFGRARWIGRVPKTAREIWISPTMWPGRFGFEIERAEVLSFRQIAASTLRADVRKGLLWFGARSMGLGKASGTALRQAQTTTSLDDYNVWRAQGRRAPQLTGIDRPRTDWSKGPAIRLAMVWDADAAMRVETVLAELRRQAYPRWSLAIAVNSNVKLPRSLLAAVADERVLRLDADARISALAEGLEARDIIGRLGSDEHLSDLALPCLAEFAALEPGARVFYTDEDQRGLDGAYLRPKLKPDWSPVFESQGQYLGHSIYARASVLAQSHENMTVRAFVAFPADAPFVAGTPASHIAHLRRVLLSRTDGVDGRNANPSQGGASAVPSRRGDSPRAAIIIPNKDRIRLLSECLSSLRNTRIEGDFEIVVVDNGSVSLAARKYYEKLRDDPKVRVIYRPGPFNFSALCNAGAESANARNLVFLNNDTVARQRHWLAEMLTFAERPQIGAVGAKLTYKSGHLQHAGIVLGMDRIAGHIGYQARARDPGYLGRFQCAHETSAVTGACLTVDREKFNAVGGFDAENLPVELGDVDLCLRLEEKGWVSIFAPKSVVVHHESVSRGKSIESHKRYERECAYFARRWARRIRDDPYFHPALSLDSSTPALG